MQNRSVAKLESVSKAFGLDGLLFPVLKGINLEIAVGEVIAVVGSSGSGKSTFLHILGLIDKADSGRVMIGDLDCSALDDHEAANMRRCFLGFVYQFHHLLPEFSAIENLKITQDIKKDSANRSSLSCLYDLLDCVGMSSKAEHRLHQLSGGERQRIAIARALVNNPKLILADEPTGNLDQNNAELVFDLLLSTVKEKNSSALIVTHNIDLAKKADRVLLLNQGALRLF